MSVKTLINYIELDVFYSMILQMGLMSYFVLYFLIASTYIGGAGEEGT